MRLSRTAMRCHEGTKRLWNHVRGSVNASEKEVRDFLFGQVLDNPAYLSIYQQREQNPRAFEGMRRQLGREFAKQASERIDPEATEDRFLVAAAVRGASESRAPEERAPEYGHMTHSDFSRDIRARYGFDPGV